MAQFTLEKAPDADPQLEARVAALRRLATEDSLPAVREVVRLCATGQPVTVKREVDGPGRLLGRKESVQLCLRASASDSANGQAPPPVREAAVVFGALSASLPAEMWRGRQVVEVGCSTGYVGLVLATLGARVTMMDRPEFEGFVTAAIARNSSVIRRTAAASFSPIDLRRPRALAPACAALRAANVVVLTDPVDTEEALDDFLVFIRALVGLDGGLPLCSALEGLLMVHKHTQAFCIGGYSAPVGLSEARPAITHAEHIDRCSFKRTIEDEGLVVNKLDLQVPSEYAHPFVECWELSVRRAPRS
jgi:hypothetical protein